MGASQSNSNIYQQRHTDRQSHRKSQRKRETDAEILDHLVSNLSIRQMPGTHFFLDSEYNRSHLKLTNERVEHL